MYKISLNDLDKLFEAISKNESLYIPVDLKSMKRV